MDIEKLRQGDEIEINHNGVSKKFSVTYVLRVSRYVTEKVGIKVFGVTDDNEELLLYTEILNYNK